MMNYNQMNSLSNFSFQGSRPETALSRQWCKYLKEKWHGLVGMTLDALITFDCL